MITVFAVLYIIISVVFGLDVLYIACKTKETTLSFKIIVPLCVMLFHPIIIVGVSIIGLISIIKNNGKKEE